MLCPVLLVSYLVQVPIQERQDYFQYQKVTIAVGNLIQWLREWSLPVRIIRNPILSTGRARSSSAGEEWPLQPTSWKALRRYLATLWVWKEILGVLLISMVSGFGSRIRIPIGACLNSPVLVCICTRFLQTIWYMQAVLHTSCPNSWFIHLQWENLYGLDSLASCSS